MEVRLPFCRRERRVKASATSVKEGERKRKIDFLRRHGCDPQELRSRLVTIRALKGAAKVPGFSTQPFKKATLGMDDREFRRFLKTLTEIELDTKKLNSTRVMTQWLKLLAGKSERRAAEFVLLPFVIRWYREFLGKIREYYGPKLSVRNVLPIHDEIARLSLYVRESTGSYHDQQVGFLVGKSAGNLRKIRSEYTSLRKRRERRRGSPEKSQAAKS